MTKCPADEALVRSASNLKLKPNVPGLNVPPQELLRSAEAVISRISDLRIQQACRQHGPEVGCLICVVDASCVYVLLCSGSVALAPRSNTKFP